MRHRHARAGTSVETRERREGIETCAGARVGGCAGGNCERVDPSCRARHATVTNAGATDRRRTTIGRSDLVPSLDTLYAAVLFAPGMPDDVKRDMSRLTDLRLPGALFLTKPGAPSEPPA